MNSPSAAQTTAPQAFAEDVRRAAEQARQGMLGLLAVESESYPWRADAQRLVSSALAPLKQARPPQQAHAILFTGHMIDAPGRPEPRFPASAEAAAHHAILDSLKTLKAAHTGPTIGIAGGASGGDLLFHESCAALGIPTLLRLTLPPEAFLEASVTPAGETWVQRFENLHPQNTEVLGDTEDLPSWMGERKDYNVWQRTNLWLVQEAIANAPARSLLALWDGKPGDGPGGTQHLVETAPDYGVVVAPIISTQSLLA